MVYVVFFFFFQAEDGIRDGTVTGVQTCALPILLEPAARRPDPGGMGPASWSQSAALAEVGRPERVAPAGPNQAARRAGWSPYSGPSLDAYCWARSIPGAVRREWSSP